MIKHIHCRTIQVFKCPIIDFSFTNFDMVTIYFVLKGLNKTFLILIIIKKRVCIHLDAMEYKFSTSSFLAFCFEHWLSLSVRLNFIDYHEKNLRRFSISIFNTKRCQFGTIVGLLLLCSDPDPCIFLGLLAFELTFIFASDSGHNLSKSKVH